MMFSKSFGYAVKAVLYTAIMQDSGRHLQSGDIARQLGIPRFFLSKILKKLAKEGIISSVKGPSGGFIANQGTLSTPLMRIFEQTEGKEIFKNCVLNFRTCDQMNPCPLHHQMDGIRNSLQALLGNTSIGDLLKENKSELIKSISSVLEITIPHEQNRIVANDY
jgi:Rrf2 family protein